MKKNFLKMSISLVVVILLLLPAVLVPASAAVYPTQSCIRMFTNYEDIPQAEGSNSGKVITTILHRSSLTGSTNHYMESYVRIETTRYCPYDEFYFSTYKRVVWTNASQRVCSFSDTVLISSNSYFVTTEHDEYDSYYRHYYASSYTYNGVTSTWITDIDSFVTVYYYTDGVRDTSVNPGFVQAHADNAYPAPSDGGNYFWITYYDYTPAG